MKKLADPLIIEDNNMLEKSVKLIVVHSGDPN